jgi:hypothetical protein
MQLSTHVSLMAVCSTTFLLTSYHGGPLGRQSAALDINGFFATALLLLQLLT